MQVSMHYLRLLAFFTLIHDAAIDIIFLGPYQLTLEKIIIIKTFFLHYIALTYFAIFLHFLVNPLTTSLLSAYPLHIYYKELI